MTDLTDRYLACWNATTPDDRRALLEATFTPRASYVDPMAAVFTRDDLDTVITAVQSQFPGFTFTAVGRADTHHNVTRFSWGLGPAGAEPVVVGFDVITTEPDGRIGAVLGFLDRVPG
jgi:SnoaL-like domain